MRFSAVISAIIVTVALSLTNGTLFAQEKDETAYNEVINTRIQNSNIVTIFICDDNKTTYSSYYKQKRLLLEIIETHQGGIFIRYFDDTEVDGVYSHYQWTVASSVNPPAKVSIQIWFIGLRASAPNLFYSIIGDENTDCRFFEEIYPHLE